MVEARSSCDSRMCCVAGATQQRGGEGCSHHAQRSLLLLQRCNHMRGTFSNTVAEQDIAAMGNARVACSHNPTQHSPAMEGMEARARVPASLLPLSSSG